MSDLRRSHQCRHDGCDSEAKWTLGLHISSSGIARNRMSWQCPTTVQVCDKHTDAAIRLLMDPRNKTAFALALRGEGLPPPDWNSAVPIFAPILEKPALDADPGESTIYGTAH